MKRITLSDLLCLLLAEWLLFWIKHFFPFHGPAWLEQYTDASPSNLFLLFFAGILLFCLMEGRPPARVLARLCAAGLAAGAALTVFCLANVQIAGFVSGWHTPVRRGWPFTLMLALPIWLQGVLFGRMLRFATEKKRTAFSVKFLLFRIVRLTGCLALAKIYQLSWRALSPLLNYQGVIASAVYFAAPIVSIFWEILFFRTASCAPPER